MEEARRCGLRQIIVEGDSKDAIEAIYKFPERLNWRSYGRIGDNLKSLRVSDSCVFFWVNRGANENVHYLPRWAASKIMSGGHPNIHEFFPEFFCIYAEIDPLSFAVDFFQ